MAKQHAAAKKGGKADKKTPKTPKTKANVPGASGSVPSDHNSRLNADDERRLFLSHRETWNRHQAAQKLLDEKRTKIVSALKADGFKVLHMDIADDLGTPKGEKKQTAAVEDRLKVARWVGHPMGAQMDLFNQPDRTPSVDRAFDQGKQASMEGAAKKPPYAPDSEQYRSWMAGWEKDQERLRQTVGKGKGDEPVAGEKVSRSEFKKRLQENSAEGDKLTKPEAEKAPPAEPTAPGTPTAQ